MSKPDLCLDLNNELGDRLVVEILKSCKEACEKDIYSIAKHASEQGLRPHLQEDLQDNAKVISAIDTLLKFFGANNG